MNWLIWRLHRKQFMVFGILLLLFAAVVVPTGNHFWHTYQHALATCAQTDTCSDIQNTLFQGDGAIINSILLAALAAPFLLGLFLGAPLLAKEYEEGTNKLAWTQTATRRKWLTAKLVWALLFAALFGLTMSLLMMWWGKTENSLFQDRFAPSHFDTQGFMPVVYAVFATSLGAALGAGFRKVLVGLAVTLGVLVFLQTAFAVYVRQHYQVPQSLSSALSPEKGTRDGLPDGANWLLSKNIVDGNGNVYDNLSPENMPEKCKALIDQRASRPGVQVEVKNAAGNVPDCLASLGYHVVTKYEPSYRYWNFQRIEAGIYLGMTSVTIAATYWLVLKRDA